MKAAIPTPSKPGKRRGKGRGGATDALQKASQALTVPLAYWGLQACQGPQSALQLEATVYCPEVMLTVQLNTFNHRSKDFSYDTTTDTATMISVFFGSSSQVIGQPIKRCKDPKGYVRRELPTGYSTSPPFLEV